MIPIFAECPHLASVQDASAPPIGCAVDGTSKDFTVWVTAITSRRRNLWHSTGVMASPRNTLLSGEQTLGRILDLLEQHKLRLCEIIESEHSTPQEQYEALMRLASLTGTLTNIATEPR